MPQKTVSKDVFADGTIGRFDIGYILIFYLFVGLIVLFGYIQSGASGSSYGPIYTPIFILTFSGILGLAYISKGKLVGAVLYGKINTSRNPQRDTLIALGVGWSVGIMMVFSNQIVKALSWAPLPLSIASSTALGGAAALASLFIFGFVDPILEESFTSGGLLPTFMRSLNFGAFPLVCLFATLIFLFLFQIPLLVIVFGALTILYPLSATFRNFIVRRGHEHEIAIALVMIIFALYHITSYGNLTSALALMANAALFMLVVSIVNWKMQNILSSIITHSIVNSFFLAIALGEPLIVAAIMPIAISFALYLPVLRSKAPSPRTGAFYVSH